MGQIDPVCSPRVKKINLKKKERENFSLVCYFLKLYFAIYKHNLWTLTSF